MTSIKRNRSIGGRTTHGSGSTGGRTTHGSGSTSGVDRTGITVIGPDGVINPPDLTTDGFGKDYYTNLWSDQFSHGTQNNMWESFFSALAYGQKQGLSMDEVLNMLSRMGVLTGAKDSYLQQIYELIIKQFLTNEQRTYDKSVLQEQRIFDSPTNQLARLTGAGISRDAAIQMLSGSGQGSQSSLVGSGSQTSLPSTVDPVNVLNGSLNTANTIINGMQTIASFARMGVSLSQQSVITDGQRIQNNLNQNILDGVNAANNVVSSVGNAITSGTLPKETFDAFTNAEQLLNYVLDHKDTDAFRSLFADGSFDRCFGTTYGRNALSNLWRDLLDSRSSGTQLDQRLNQMDNAITLQNMSKVQFINDINYGIINNQRAQVQLQQDIVDLMDGTIQLQIDGQILSQEQIHTLLAEFEYNQAETANRIFDGVYNTEDEDGHTGVYYASKKELNDLYKYCVVSSAERTAMSDDWVDNYKKSFYESGRNILLSLLLKNAYTEGSLDMFTTNDYSPNVPGTGVLGSGSTTNAAGDAVILVNQTPLLQGINLIRNAANNDNLFENSQGTQGNSVRRLDNARTGARVARKIITKGR